MSEGPGLAALFGALEATWPAERRLEAPDGRWTLGLAPGGGSRVNAIRARAPELTEAEIAAAEAAARAQGAAPLWMTAEGDATLRTRLLARGRQPFDPSEIWFGPVDRIAEAAGARRAARAGDRDVRAAVVRCPLAALDRFWAERGVGAARRAIMDRVATPAAAVVVRADQRLGGVAFVAVAPEPRVVFVHALEVSDRLRGIGVGPALLAAAADFGRRSGAVWLAAATRAGNANMKRLLAAVGAGRAVGYVYMREDAAREEDGQAHA